MIDCEKIEQYVSELLRLSGLDLEGESASGTLLFHAYVAVAMFELMDEGERALIKGVQRRMKYFFSSNFNLKERKRKTEKEILPPTPLSLEKENKEKEEKTTLSAGRELSLPLSDLEKRQNAFKMEIWNHRGDIDMDMLNDFYYYWTDVNPKTKKMRFEEQRYKEDAIRGAALFQRGKASAEVEEKRNLKFYCCLEDTSEAHQEEERAGADGG